MLQAGLFAFLLVWVEGKTPQLVQKLLSTAESSAAQIDQQWGSEAAPSTLLANTDQCGLFEGSHGHSPLWIHTVDQRVLTCPIWQPTSCPLEPMLIVFLRHWLTRHSLTHSS